MHRHEVRQVTAALAASAYPTAWEVSAPVLQCNAMQRKPCNAIQYGFRADAPSGFPPRE